jgi:hypothetical protein
MLSAELVGLAKSSRSKPSPAAVADLQERCHLGAELKDAGPKVEFFNSLKRIYPEVPSVHSVRTAIDRAGGILTLS